MNAWKADTSGMGAPRLLSRETRCQADRRPRRARSVSVRKIAVSQWPFPALGESVRRNDDNSPSAPLTLVLQQDLWDRLPGLALELNGLLRDHGGDPRGPEQQPRPQVSAKPWQALRGRTTTLRRSRSRSSSACTSRVPPNTDPGSRQTRFRIVVSPVRGDDSGILLDVHAGSSNADGLPIRIAFGHLTRVTQPPGGTARVVGEHHRSVP